MEGDKAAAKQENEFSGALFHRIGGDVFPFPAMVAEIKTYLAADPAKEFVLMIGTDSEEREESVDFITAIVVYKKGAGGRYFWRSHTISGNYRSLFERIWEEALMSLRFSAELIEAVRDIKNRFSFELHVDIGDRGETKAIVKEIVSSLKASGLLVKTKPDSIAASKVADRHL